MNAKNIATWVVRAVLALLFVMAGVSKLIMTAEQMSGPVALPVAFLRFIGVCETLGGLGLVLPGLLKVKTWLTPLAALGLAIIMVGAVVVTLLGGGGAAALMPGVVGVLCVVVAKATYAGRPAPHAAIAGSSA